jgi:hypothetical protein
MPLAATGEQIVLNSLLTGRYLSLHTALPPLGEITGGGYARQLVAFTQSSGPDPTVYRNADLIQYDPATTNWGYITHFGIWSTLTGGQLLAYSTIANPNNLSVDDVAQWEVGSLTVDTN